jgi:FAD/FMN-containing dehydrogenase
LAAGAGGALAFSPFLAGRAEASTFVNDIHSQLNRTLVERVVWVNSEDALRKAIGEARKERRAISVGGGRHAMGGQQFAHNSVMLDTRSMRSIVSLDKEKGIVEVEAGIQWPALIEGLGRMQAGDARPWGIVQKQTGADRLTIGGALAANIHGRGLTLKPIIEQVESFSLMDGEGRVRECSRTENGELFRLVIGGYGLFGVITRVRLRLMRRTKLERNVQIVNVENLMPAFEARIKEGYLYGDCQFSTDTQSDTFLRTGVFSCYRPLPADAEMPATEKELGESHWRELYLLSHTDTKRAYDAYTSYYLSTSGQRYWSDTNQLSVYIDNYHQELDRKLGAKHKGTEMITELYVPRPALPAFLDSVRADFRENGVRVIYGTIRLIERDDESFLAWAREPWVCTVMNLHVEHSRDGLRKAEQDFRRLIDRAIEQGGSYFLTYHRWATRQQVETCYPQMAEFLKLKRKYDPGEVFQSDWYRHYRRMLAGRR